MRFSNLLLFFSLTVGVASASTSTPSEVLSVCSSFCTKLSISFTPGNASIARNVLPNGRGTSWTVSEGEKFFVVEDDFDYVSAYSNGAAEVAAKGGFGGAPFFLTDQLAWVRADAIRLALDPQTHLSRSSFTDSAASGQGSRPSRGLVGFVFTQVVSGVDTTGVGNSMSMTLDRQTGVVTSLTWSKGWRYEGQRTVTENAAKERAREILASNDPSLLSPIRSVSVQYMHVGSGFGSTTRDEARRARIARLAYVIRFDRCQVFVDAETGRSIGGKRKGS